MRARVESRSSKRAMGVFDMCGSILTRATQVKSRAAPVELTPLPPRRIVGMGKPLTIAELRSSGYTSRSVKQELRDNLIARLKSAQPLFSGIVGYEDSVVPQIENAVLSGQDIVFLGERG